MVDRVTWPLVCSAAETAPHLEYQHEACSPD